MEQNKFHNSFKLNNTCFASVNDLLSYAKEFSEPMHAFLKQWFSSSNVVSVVTSGSTGVPKPIVLQKDFMINSAVTTGKFFNLQQNTTALLCLPITYIAGKMMLVRALTLGWHLKVIPPDATPLKNVTTTYDFCAMVPLQLQNSLSKLHLIKKIIIGGGVVSHTLQKQVQNISTDVFATYGMTETITHIAIKKLNNCDEVPSFYKVLPNITIYKDIRNCLVINAPRVATKTLFTNDVVQLVSDTQFEWLGRFDNVINSGGVKLHPEKIEEKLSKIITNRFFVTAIPDKILGEKLIVIIELEAKNNRKNCNFIKEKIKNVTTLSKFEIPKEIYFLSEFIETETKKIQRKKTLALLNF